MDTGMRIAILGSMPPNRGGIERFLDDYVRGLAARGHAVLVISDADAASVERRDGVTIQRLPLRRAMEHATSLDPLEAVSQAMREALEDFGPEIVHLHPSGFEVFAYRIALKALRGVPRVLTLHAIDHGKLILSSFQEADIVTGVSHTLTASLRALCPDIQLVENALPPGPPPPPFEATGRISALGRMVVEKGFDTLIDATALVRARHPEATLALAGEGTALEQVRAKAGQVLGEGACDLRGWVSGAEKRAFFAAAQVVVVPSRWEEPFGLVALEAALHARPVVVTDRGELPHLVVPGKTGLVVPAEDPSAMAEAITELLKDPARAEAMGRAGRAHVTARFDFDTMMARYETLLEDARRRRA